MSKFRPRYPYDSDYTTNAPSYYDDLARKQKLIKELAKRIWEYDKTLAESLEELQTKLDNYIHIIDGKIELIDHKIGEGFNDVIENLLIQWVNDGTLDHIINETLMNRKVDKEDYQKDMNEVEQRFNNIENLTNYELLSKGREKKGFTVFISDDGRLEEYTIAKDIFSSFNVPQSIAIVPDWVGNEGFCNVDQLLELQNDYGWEIMSHSLTHPQPFPNISDEQAEIEIGESRKALKNMGFHVNNYAYPGGNYGKRERMLTKKYFRSARCSNAGYHQGVNYTPLNTNELKTIWLDPSASPLNNYLNQYTRSTAIQMIIDYCKDSIDEARRNNGLVIISTHFRFIDSQDLQNAYKEVIAYAKANTEVTTLNNALNHMGNIVDIGDYSEQGARGFGSGHFVIGADGFGSGTLTVAEPNRITATTPFSHIPFGVTVCTIDSQHLEGLPMDVNNGGTLISYKPYFESNSGGGYAWQEFISWSNQQQRFRRDVINNSNYSEWFSDSMLNAPRYNTFDTTTPFSDFPNGITISRITTNNPNINDAPEGESGVLITYKFESTDTMASYSYQEYHVRTKNVEYRRRVIDGEDFGGWFIVGFTTMSNQNNFDTTTPLRDFNYGTTYSIITTNNPNLADAPEGHSGTLITHKVVYEGQESYSFQEYTLRNGKKYLRHATGSTTWGEWGLL